MSRDAKTVTNLDSFKKWLYTGDYKQYTLSTLHGYSIKATGIPTKAPSDEQTDVLNEALAIINELPDAEKTAVVAYLRSVDANQYTALRSAANDTSSAAAASTGSNVAAVVGNASANSSAAVPSTDSNAQTEAAKQLKATIQKVNKAIERCGTPDNSESEAIQKARVALEASLRSEAAVGRMLQPTAVELSRANMNLRIALSDAEAALTATAVGDAPSAAASPTGGGQGAVPLTVSNTSVADDAQVIARLQQNIVDRIKEIDRRIQNALLPDDLEKKWGQCESIANVSGVKQLNDTLQGFYNTATKHPTPATLAELQQAYNALSLITDAQIEHMVSSIQTAQSAKTPTAAPPPLLPTGSRAAAAATPMPSPRNTNDGTAASPTESKAYASTGPSAAAAAVPRSEAAFTETDSAFAELDDKRKKAVLTNAIEKMKSNPTALFDRKCKQLTVTNTQVAERSCSFTAQATLTDNTVRHFDFQLLHNADRIVTIVKNLEPKDAYAVYAANAMHRFNAIHNNDSHAPKVMTLGRISIGEKRDTSPIENDGLYKGCTAQQKAVAEALFQAGFERVEVVINGNAKVSIGNPNLPPIVHIEDSMTPQMRGP